MIASDWGNAERNDKSLLRFIQLLLTLSLIGNHGQRDPRRCCQCNVWHVHCTVMTTTVIVCAARLVSPIASAGINSAVSAASTETRLSLAEISQRILAICALMLKSSCMHQYLMSNKDVSAPQYFGAGAIGIMSTVFTQPHPWFIQRAHLASHCLAPRRFLGGCQRQIQKPGFRTESQP